MPPRTDVLQGTLDLLILKALALGPRHGLSISRRIDQLTRGTFHVGPGSLFPALHRMEDAGWVKAEWKASDNNRRARYYRITAGGRRRLAQVERGWTAHVDAVMRVLKLA